MTSQPRDNTDSFLEVESEDERSKRIGKFPCALPRIPTDKKRKKSTVWQRHDGDCLTCGKTTFPLLILAQIIERLLASQAASDRPTVGVSRADGTPSFPASDGLGPYRVDPPTARKSLMDAKNPRRAWLVSEKEHTRLSQIQPRRLMNYFSTVLERAAAFLPQLRQANEELDPETANIEHGESGEGRYIEMVRCSGSS